MPEQQPVMQEFKVGDRVKLTGEGWALDGGPRRGQVVTLEWVASDSPFDYARVATFHLGGEIWTAYPEPRNPFFAEATEGSINSRPTVGQQGIGFLDGMLNLPMQSASEEYEAGYQHGSTVRERIGSL